MATSLAIAVAGARRTRRPELPRDDATSHHPAHPDDARWRDAFAATASLWLFVLLIYLPVIVERHAGEGTSSVALDSATIFVSMLFALPLFAAFRATLRWPIASRLAAVGGMLATVAISQAVFDLLFTAWVTRTVERGWAALPVNLHRGYGAAINYVSVFGVNLALFQLACARRRTRRQDHHHAAIRASGQEAALEAFRFRLNPHFLFNTLNAISAMIVTGRATEADRMVERLAAFLRLSYLCDPMVPVPLEEELAAVDQYARIEETRFQDRIAITLRCGSGTEHLRVPPLMMQPVLEAVIDAASTARAIVRIELRSHRKGDMLLLDLSHTPSISLRSGKLDVVRDRLDTLFGAEAGLKVDNGRVTVWLPADHGEAGR